MDRVRELKKLGPPAPVKGERARSKRRVPVVAVIGERAWILQIEKPKTLKENIPADKTRLSRSLGKLSSVSYSSEGLA